MMKRSNLSRRIPIEDKNQFFRWFIVKLVSSRREVRVDCSILLSGVSSVLISYFPLITILSIFSRLLYDVMVHIVLFQIEWGGGIGLHFFRSLKLLT